MILFAVGFVVSLLFFGYVVFENPGPIDKGVFEVPVRFSKANADERAKQWKELSAENISYGEQLYKVNCTFCHAQGGAQDLLLDRAQSGQIKYGAKPLELYNSIRNGFGMGSHKLEHIPERERWALIAFVRSKMQNAPDDSSSEWKKFLKEGRY